MALRHEQILPAIIVEIFQADAPTGTSRSQGAETAFQTLIAERAFAIIVIQGIEFAGKLGHHKIRAAVVVIVLEDSTHAGKALAVGGEAGAGLERAFPEGTIAVVVEKVLLHA